MNTADLTRLISNLIRIGEVIELQASPLAARVKIGDNETDWISIAHSRAGQSNDFDPPSIGEQVVLLSASGDLSQAIIIASLHSSTHDQPSSSLHEFIRTFGDGTRLSYNSETHKLLIDAKADVELFATGNLNIHIDGDASITVGGDAAVSAQGNITADAPSIALNGGAGVVTGNHICAFTGSPHSHCSSTVTAGQ